MSSDGILLVLIAAMIILVLDHTEKDKDLLDALIEHYEVNL